MAAKFARLTRPAVRALSAGDSITERGITALCEASGDTRYSVNIMVDGQRIHRVIGRDSDGITREQAERAIEAFRTKAREGRLDLPTGRKVSRSFTEAAEEYLARIENNPKHGRNLKRKRSYMLQRLIPYFKTQRPDKLTDFAIANYTKQRGKEGAGIATINRELATLSHFLNRCIEWGWMKSKPKIDKRQEARKQIVVLTPTDQQRLMTAAVGDQDPLTWLFAEIAMGTAMRHSEVLRIRWEEISFSQRRIYIGKAKAGQREQPIPPALAAMLENQWAQLGEPRGYLFPTSKQGAKYAHRQHMSKQFRRAVERAGLDPAKVTPHVLRHTAITKLVEAGVDLPTIQKISGHKTLAMVMRYTHLSGDHIDNAVAKLDHAFPDTVTPELHTVENDRKLRAV